MKSITRKPIDAPAWTLRRGVPQAGKYAASYVSEDELHDGSLILVNKAHPVTAYTLRLAAVTNGIIQAAGREEPRMTLDAECLAQLSALLDACEGRDEIAVVSGYHSKKRRRASIWTRCGNADGHTRKATWRFRAQASIRPAWPSMSA